jgi:hypothetical protein
VDNVMAFFYHCEFSFRTRAPQMLDSLPTRTREIILANMKQSASLTLGILKSLYQWANLDAASEGFVATCSDE